MNPVTRKYMTLLGRITVNDRGNTGIVWHAGNKPHPDATHFIGNTAGNQVQFELDTSNPNINATEVSNAMLLHVRNQCRVRLVRYVMYKSWVSYKCTGYNNMNCGIAGKPTPGSGKDTILDVTSTGFVSTLGVPADMGDITPLFSAGSDISLQTFTDYYEKLYNRYIATYRNSGSLLSDTVCHTNCHDQCHGSRGRR